MGITPIVLGPAAKTYLSSYLAGKGDLLSKCKLDNRLDDGVLVTFLPPCINGDRIEFLERPGIAEDPDLVDAIKGAVVQFIAGFLGAGTDRVLLVETYLESRLPSADSLCSFSYRPTRFGTWNGAKWSPHAMGLCLYITSGEHDVSNIETALYGIARVGTGFLGRMPNTLKDTIRSGQMLGDSEMRELAENMWHIIVPAYDGESWLFSLHDQRGYG